MPEELSPPPDLCESTTRARGVKNTRTRGVKTPPLPKKRSRPGGRALGGEIDVARQVATMEKLLLTNAGETYECEDRRDEWQ